MKGYRTLILNGAICALPWVDAALNHGEIVGAVLGPNGAAVLSVLGLVNVVLRWITTTPVMRAS